MSDQRKEQILKELDKFNVDQETVSRITDLQKGSSIHSFMGKALAFIGNVLALIVIIRVGGSLGLISGLCFAASSIALILEAVDKYRSKRLAAKEYARFLEELRAKGLLDDNEDI